MKKREETPEREYTKVETFKVGRVNQYKEIVFFDLTVNGVTIYGCKVGTTKEGQDFIAFPSNKGKDKNGKERYFNVAYISLDSYSQNAILEVVEEKLNS